MSVAQRRDSSDCRFVIPGENRVELHAVRNQPGNCDPRVYLVEVAPRDQRRINGNSVSLQCRAVALFAPIAVLITLWPLQKYDALAAVNLDEMLDKLARAGFIFKDNR